MESDIGSATGANVRDDPIELQLIRKKMAQCITREMGENPHKAGAVGSDEIRATMRLVCGTWPGNALNPELRW